MRVRISKKEYLDTLYEGPVSCAGRTEGDTAMDFQVPESLQQIVPNMADWWQRAMNRYNRRNSLKEQHILGPSQRAMTVQRYVLHYMRSDPAITAEFRPTTSKRLTILWKYIDDADIGVIFRKVDYHKGKLRSGGIKTKQRQKVCREARLSFADQDVSILVCGARIVEDMKGRPSIDSVYLGIEKLNGFVGFVQIWSAQNGYLTTFTPASQPLLPLPATVKIRTKPVAQPADNKVSAVAKKAVQPRKKASRKNA